MLLLRFSFQMLLYAEWLSNNRMRMTRDLFKKIRGTKGTFYAKMGSIKDRNGLDLTEAEILRRSFKNIQKSESEVAQLCLTLCDPVDYSPPGSSVHGVLQARILEWVAISFSKGYSRHKDRSWVSSADSFTISGRFFTI